MSDQGPSRRRFDHSHRPVHLHWRYLGLVFLGGMGGTALRELLSLAIGPLGDLPVTTAGINIMGALALGVLLETLVRRGSDFGGRRSLRLLLGTGLLGGFTTYSSLATDAAGLLREGNLPLALGYALGTLLLGALATWLGVVGAASLHRRLYRRRSLGDSG